jgi:GNAT superfamily N-acetyltransferase
MTPPPDDSFLIRVAGLSDAEKLARLRYHWRVDERGERGLDEQSFAEGLRSWMDDHRSSHVPFLALRSGEPVGTAWLALVDRVPGPGHFVRRSAYVQSVFVIPPERSLGVGTRLMRLVVDHARHLGLDYVAVHPSEHSFSLYRRVGFTDTDRVLELRT